MASSLTSSALTLLLLLLISLISPSCPLTCTSQTFSGNKVYDHCNDLPQLGSYLHWSYDASNSKSTLSIALVAQPAKPNGWIAWAINPAGTGMVGAQALIAFKQAGGSMAVKSYNISSYASIVESDLSFDVTEKSAEASGGTMRIFATIVLPDKRMTTVNHVWQVGPAVIGGFPAKHDFQPANLNSKGSLHLLSGHSSNGGNDMTKKKNIHGILNVVSWGIMFPIGAIIARYIRAFESADPAWFYLHVFCQCSAYVIGVSGWGTGLKLGSESKGVTYTNHRNIGIALFALATVQIFALLLRPKKEHKYRFYWNIYHHGVGYAILVLGIINVFKGLEILDPEEKWRTAYIVVISALGGIALLLEAVTWVIVARRKSTKFTKPYDPS